MDYMYGVTTRSVYSPLLLFPQAFVIRYAGRSMNLPALTVFYLTRLAGLLSYMLLTWISVRIIPYGKWLFAVLALAPMALLQAVTVSADTISNGIAFLYIAGILALVQKDEIGWKEWWGLFFLTFLLFAAKVILIFLALLPFFLLLPKSFQKKHFYLLFVIATGLLFSVEVLGWSILAYPRLGTAPDGTDPVGQVKFILGNAPVFMTTLFTDAFGNIFSRFKNWIVLYGYNYWPVPVATYWLYGGALFTSLFIQEETEAEPSKKHRLVFVLLFLLGYAATIILMYLSFTPVGFGEVIGVQGRYFTVVMPFLFLALFAIAKPGPALSRRGIGIILLLGTASLTTYSVGGWLSYHVPCGSQYYRTDLCYQPKYKNFSPESSYSAPIAEHLILQQEVFPECDGMSEFRVWLNAEDSLPGQQIYFSLLSQNQIIFEEEVLAQNLPTAGWYSFSFDPIWDSSEHLYTFKIQSNEPESSARMRVAYSLRPEYPLGKLFENGEASQQDMIFQYGCVAGWEKLRHDRQN